MGIPASEGEQAAVDRYVHAEANRALTRGARYLSLFGLASAVLVTALMALGLARDLWVLVAFAVVGGLLAGWLWREARAGRVRGGRMYALLLPLVSLPTAFFAFAEVLMPWGAATYLTGPFSYLYFPLIVATGFFFDRRLARLAGAFAAAQYAACVVVAWPRIAAIRVADEATAQDLGNPLIYLVKLKGKREAVEVFGIADPAEGSPATIVNPGTW